MSCFGRQGSNDALSWCRQGRCLTTAASAATGGGKDPSDLCSSRTCWRQKRCDDTDHSNCHGNQLSNQLHAGPAHPEKRMETLTVQVRIVLGCVAFIKFTKGLGRQVGVIWTIRPKQPAFMGIYEAVQSF